MGKWELGGVMCELVVVGECMASKLYWVDAKNKVCVCIVLYV